MDEAHRYIRKNGGYILRENIFEKIAREGRKYSLVLDERGLRGIKVCTFTIRHITHTTK